jgi:predicted nucleotidyltransferase
MTQDELLQRLRRELCAHPGLDFALLFGSWARERQHPGSDVDVAIMPREDWSLAAEVDLQGQLAAALGAEVDLVRLDEAPLLVAWEVVSNAIPICGEPQRWARYQAEIALEHADAGPDLDRAARHYARRIAELGVPR